MRVNTQFYFLFLSAPSTSSRWITTEQTFGRIFFFCRNVRVQLVVSSLIFLFQKREKRGLNPIYSHFFMGRYVFQGNKDLWWNAHSSDGWNVSSAFPNENIPSEENGSKAFTNSFSIVLNFELIWKLMPNPRQASVSFAFWLPHNKGDYFRLLFFILLIKNLWNA